jgi:hypothetical protein
MKRRKNKKITDEMIGMDERVCSCASRVVNMIAGQKEPGSLKEIIRSLEQKEGKDETKKH